MSEITLRQRYVGEIIRGLLSQLFLVEPANRPVWLDGLPLMCFDMADKLIVYEEKERNAGANQEK